MKKVLSIAGSDCSGGAGIQADLKTFSAHGVYGMSVIVSVVAENTCRVLGIQDVSPDMIGRQMDAVLEDIEVDAVKVGMLSTPDCMEAVAEKLKYYHPANIVIDPVMYAKNGCPLMEPAAIKTLIGTVIPLADVLTPNIPEAEKITGNRIGSVTDGVHIGQKDIPADAVLCFVEVWKRLFCCAFQEGGRNTEQQLRGSALTEFLVRKTGYRQEAVRTGRMTRQDLECTNYS